jgi:hypothetical protein
VTNDQYDELGLFQENATEFGLPWAGPPEVRRRAVTVAPDQNVSALVWGRGEPELVLIHGGAQNPHTWDTVAMALGRQLGRKVFVSQGAPHRQPTVGPFHFPGPLLGKEAVILEFFAIPTPADTEDETATGEGVKGGDRLGQRDRVVLAHYADGGADLEPGLGRHERLGQ